MALGLTLCVGLAVERDQEVVRPAGHRLHDDAIGGGHHERPHRVVEQDVALGVAERRERRGGRVVARAGALEDDATVMCLDWHGGPQRDRSSAAGSDR